MSDYRMTLACTDCDWRVSLNDADHVNGQVLHRSAEALRDHVVAEHPELAPLVLAETIVRAERDWFEQVVLPARVWHVEDEMSALLPDGLRFEFGSTRE